MALHLGRTLSRGLRRSGSVSGLVVLVLTLVYQFVFITAVNTVVATQLPPELPRREVGLSSLRLPIATEVALALAVGSLLVGFGVFLAAARLLSREPSTLSTVSSAAITRRFGRAFLSTVAVSLVLGVVIPLGFLLFVVPGLFLAVSFQFAVFAIAVEDTGPLAALRRSWALASGNRWRLLALVVIFAVGGAVSGSVGSVVSLVDPLAGDVFSIVFNSVFVVLMYGILAEAFVQLRETSRDIEEGERTGASAVDAL